MSRCHGRYMLYLKTSTLKRNFVKRYLIYLLIIQQWMIWMDYLIWTLSYAKLCVFIRRFLVFYGRQGRMIASLLVSLSRTRKELSAMKFGKLLNRFSQYVLIFMCGSGWYRIRKGQSVMIPINLINRDKSIWGEDATEFKLVLFLFSLLFGYPTCFFFLL